MGFGDAIIHGLFSWNSTCRGRLKTLSGSDPANGRVLMRVIGEKSKL
jgi:peroxisomal enoyl-CoA hydratase 2